MAEFLIHSLCLMVLLAHSTNVIELTKLACDSRDIGRMECLQRLELPHVFRFTHSWVAHLEVLVWLSLQLLK